MVTALSVESQTTNLARLEYTHFPQSSSDNSFRRWRGFINIPLKIWNEDYLVPGFGYRNIEFEFEDPAPFDTDRLTSFQSVRTSLGYVTKLNETWRLGVEAGLQIASDFQNDKIERDDLLLIGSIFFIKTKDSSITQKKTRLILGLRYSTAAGRPFPLPVVNFNKEVNDKWAYTLGAPKTAIKYTINKKNTLQAFITLDGFFANLQNDLQLDDGQVADSMSMTIFWGGVGYEYYFTKNLLFFAYAGHTFINDIRLRDENTEDIYTINQVNTAYVRGGFKFKL
ncbi:hypothetical protein GCM10009117_04300 [Gangjinia marincola]|uniref:DUF6268 domain-containing protein n=2 Tax=Gangjinia marincola TaxID=578463 RepID=A0ABN1MDW0_9FLAO